MRSRATRFFRQWISCWLAGKKNMDRIFRNPMDTMNALCGCLLFLSFVLSMLVVLFVFLLGQMMWCRFGCTSFRRKRNFCDWRWWKKCQRAGHTKWSEIMFGDLSLNIMERLLERLIFMGLSLQHSIVHVCSKRSGKPKENFIGECSCIPFYSHWMLLKNHHITILRFPKVS